MPTDIVQADFSRAVAGSDLTTFTPAAGARFARSPSFSGNALLATASGSIRAGTPDADCLYYTPTAPPSADFSVRLRATYGRPTGDDVVGPAIRCGVEADNFYTLIWCSFDRAGLYGLAVFKHVAGRPAQVGATLTTLGGWSVIPTEGASALLALGATGTTLRGYYNGALAFTLDDPDLAGPGCGGAYFRTGAASDGSGAAMTKFYVNPDPSYAPATGGPAPAPIAISARTRRVLGVALGSRNAAADVAATLESLGAVDLSPAALNALKTLRDPVRLPSGPVALSRVERNALTCWTGDTRAAGEFAAAVETLGAADPSGPAYRTLREFVR